MNIYDYVKKNNRFELLLEWDREGNQGIDPTVIAPSSKERIAWVCERGHHWTTMLCARVNRRSGCPYCAGQRAVPGQTDLATLRPELTALWHPTKNGSLTPETVTKGSNKKVWWRCEAGHVWQACVFSRTRKKGTGCPICAGQVKVRFRGRYQRENAGKDYRLPVSGKPEKTRAPDGVAV